MNIASRIVTATTIAIAGFACAAADPAERRIDELMHKSGLWEQIGQMQAQVRAGAEEARAEAKASGRAEDMSDADFSRLASAMNRVYAPDRMRAAVSKELAAALSVADEQEVLVWLSSDLGKRITRIEEEQGEVERYRKTDREAPEFLKTVPRERIAKFTRLADSIHVGESSATMLINLTIATIYGLASSAPGGADESVLRRLRQRFEAQRPQLVAAMTQRSIAGFAYTYRDLKDAEVESYVAFAESPAGRRYHEATTIALDNALMEASLELGRQVGALAAKEKDRRS